jgi:flagellar biosynthesis/type III secretory pathway protein FliH
MGRVIRAQRSGPNVVRADVVAAKGSAAAILESARAEAEALRAAAIAEGRATGYAEAAKQLLDLARLRSEQLRRVEQEALRAVLLVAAELVGKTLAAAPSDIADLLAPHLARMRRAQHVVLHVNPLDAAWLGEHEAELRARVELAGSLELRENDAISRGGCLLESNIGELDARLETRLYALAHALELEPPAERA